MKNTILILVFIIVHCTLNIEDCMCQWQSDYRLTYDTNISNTSSNNSWCIAANAEIMHVVWYDFRNGDEEIYYKRSPDAGISWGTDKRLTYSGGSAIFPSISISGSFIHVVWQDDRDGNTEIYHKRSTDGGLNWGSDTRLTNNTSGSLSPVISVYGSVVNVVWADYRDGNFEIYYKRSPDDGVSWGQDKRLTNNTSNSMATSISVSGSIVSVVWSDNREGNNEIYYKRSADGGINWGTDTRLTNNTNNSANPCVYASGSIVNVVWIDNRDGNYEIYYKRSSNEGITWGSDVRLTNNSYNSFSPNITASAQLIHIVWQDERNGNEEIYYKRSTDGGINWMADIRLTSNTASSTHPSVSISGSAVNIVWIDKRNGNNEIYFKRNPTGNVGIKNISSEIPEKFELGQNYPNPFNSMTNVKFQMLNAENAKILVFDLLGQEVAILVNERLESGTYEVRFHSGDLPSGIYFYQLKTENFIETKKLIILK